MSAGPNRGSDDRRSTEGAVVARRLRPEEWRAYRRVRLAALAESPAAFGSTHEAESARDDDWWRQRAAAGAAGVERVVFVAFDGDDAVGLAGGWVDPDDGTAELISMWTAPAARRRGVGRRLVEAVVGWAEESGHDRLCLWVVRGNDGAAALYEACGFAFDGTAAPEPRDDDPCREERRMVRRLGRPV